MPPLGSLVGSLVPLAVAALLLLLPGAAPASAQTDVLIDFSGTGAGVPLPDGAPVRGDEWTGLGVRFIGPGMDIVNDATCNACLAGSVVVATFERNGLPAVTGELVINHVNSPAALTIVRDASGTVLFQSAGDVVLAAPNIASVEMHVSTGVTAFGFDTATSNPTTPSCTVELTAETYADGGVVTAQTLRLVQPLAVATNVEWKLWIGGAGIAPVGLLNVTAPFPAGLDVDLGPVTVFPVSAIVPRGLYEFSCRLFDPASGRLLSEDRNPFVIE